MDLSSKSLTNGEWWGADKLGQLLEQTRDKIVAKYGPTQQIHTSHTGLEEETGMHGSSLIGKSTSPNYPPPGIDSTTVSETAHLYVPTPKADHSLSVEHDSESIQGSPTLTYGADQFHSKLQALKLNPAPQAMDSGKHEVWYILLRTDSSPTMADKPILIVADSHGRLLKSEINRTFIHLDAHDVWKSGLRIRHTADYITPIIRELKPKLIYILNGICDLTMVHSYNPWTVAL